MTTSGIPSNLPADLPLEPTRDDRSMAMLAHVLSAFSGFIGPLVIFFVKRRESRFVAFHALQALFWHLLLMVTMFGSIIVFAGIMIGSAIGHGHEPPSHGAPPPAFFFGFFGIWALMMLSWLANMGFTIYLGIQANAGRWTRYPIVGSLVARLGGFNEASK